MAYKPGRSSGPPTWFVFLVAIALVFAAYYIWLGLRDFVQTGGLGISEATEQAIVVATATAERIVQIQTELPTARPSLTPIPECQDFVVIVPNAIVRARPSTSSAIVTSFFENDVVCVIGREGDTEWYIIDSNPETMRINIAFMHESVIRALNPTLTPTNTSTPAPTVTPLSTNTKTPTILPTPSATRDPSITNTPSLTPTPTATEPMVNA